MTEYASLRRLSWHPFFGGPSANLLEFHSRMLKKSASGILTSLRGSTYRSVRLASSLAAALLDNLFEHPAWCPPVVLGVRTIEIPPCHNSVPQPVIGLPAQASAS